MGASRLVVVLVALAIIFVGGAAVIDAGLSGAGPETDVEDEEFEPVGNETISLDFSNITHAEYSETVTVEDQQGDIFLEDGNYTWNSNNGTIFVVNESALANESTAFITYSFAEPVEEARQLVAAYSLLSDDAQPALLIVVGVAVLLAATRVFGGA